MIVKGPQLVIFEITRVQDNISVLWSNNHRKTIKIVRNQLVKNTKKTYTRQLRSVSPSMKSNSWLMSYVIEGLFGYVLFKCSS